MSTSRRERLGGADSGQRKAGTQLSVPLPSLNALLVFETAARHQRFTRAAAELGVTQTAVSHQVKALEGELGMMLFRRSPRRLVLTAEGQAWAAELHRIF